MPKNYRVCDVCQKGFCNDQEFVHHLRLDHKIIIRSIRDWKQYDVNSEDEFGGVF